MTTPPTTHHRPHWQTLRGLRQRARGERGSVTVEVALSVPLVVLLFFLLVGAFHLARANLDVNAAASAAARAASISRGNPQADATATAQANLAGRCAKTWTEFDTSTYRRGGTVTVKVHCVVTTRGLTGISVNGSVELVGESTSPIDLYRPLP